MANPIKGETPLHLSDGREFMLVMDIEALVEAETAYGKPTPEMMGDAQRGFLGAVRAMLWGALRAKHPALTLREASGLLAADVQAVREALERATVASFPKQTEGEETGNAPRPRGRTSGGNGAKRA